jgi:hypothetical protein
MSTETTPSLGLIGIRSCCLPNCSGASENYSKQDFAYCSKQPWTGKRIMITEKSNISEFASFTHTYNRLYRKAAMQFRPVTCMSDSHKLRQFPKQHNSRTDGDDDRLWGLVVSFGLQIQRFEFDSRRYQIFWEVALERWPLSLVSTTEVELKVKLVTGPRWAANTKTDWRS